MKKAFGILVLFITALFLLTGCSLKSPGPSALSMDQVLTKSYDSMQNVKSFHFILDHNTGGTKISSVIVMTKMEGDVAKPDRMQAKISGTAAGMSLEMQLVAADGKILMTNPLNGKWETPASQLDVLNVFDPGKGIAAIIKGISSPAGLKDEKVGNVLCYHLKGTVSSTDLKPITGVALEGATADIEVWIAKDGFLIQEVKVTGKIADGDVDGIVRTLTFSNYDKNVDIKLPQ